MAIPPFNPDITLPEDDDFASQFPLVERAFRDIIDSWIGAEHDRNGHHRVVGLSDQVDDRPDGDDDLVTIWQEGALILVRIEALGTLYSIPYYAYDEDNPGIPNTAFTDMPEGTIKGRAFDSDDGLPQDLTGAEVAAIVAPFTPDTGSAVGLKGLVPASAIGDATKGKVLGASGSFINTGPPHAYLEDQKASGTAGGTFTGGSPGGTRHLNTKVWDPGGIVTLTSHKFTLQPGTYVIWWEAPAYSVGNHQAWLYNDTTSAAVAWGSGEHSTASQTKSAGMARVTIASATVFLIKHICQTTQSTNGGGVAVTTGSEGGIEVFTRVAIWKEG